MLEYADFAYQTGLVDLHGKNAMRLFELLAKEYFPSVESKIVSLNFIRNEHKFFHMKYLINFCILVIIFHLSLQSIGIQCCMHSFKAVTIVMFITFYNQKHWIWNHIANISNKIMLVFS